VWPRRLLVTRAAVMKDVVGEGCVVTSENPWRKRFVVRKGVVKWCRELQITVKYIFDKKA
jgi:hypothetical protein